MGTWSSTAMIEGSPEQVLGVLTDPDACRRWAPVAFEVDDLAGERLGAGTTARVGGRLAGREVGFDVRILTADERALRLRATGPIDIEARYDAEPRADRTHLRAEVSVRGRGLMGRALSAATDGLLAAGALDVALWRIAAEARG